MEKADKVNERHQHPKQLQYLQCQNVAIRGFFWQSKHNRVMFSIFCVCITSRMSILESFTSVLGFVLLSTEHLLVYHVFTHK